MNPALVRHLVYPLHEWVRGRSTFADLRTLENTQWLSPDELGDLQASKLRELLRHAYDNCSYYRRVFGQARVDPATDDPREALARLPLLDKRTIRACRDDMTWHDAPGGVREAVTGGSTGDPLRFRFDRRRQGFDKAARMRTHRWFGVEVGDREVYLWGSPLEIGAQDRLKSCRDRLTNEKLLSAFDLTAGRMDAYLNTIARYDPACVFGYPSSLVLLCRHGSKRGRVVRPRSLRVVFTTGEVLDDGQRGDIENYFRVPVANAYGSREAGFIAHDCLEGSMHVTDENVIVEIIDDSGCPVQDRECGEIVVTHLDAYAMPLIRYRTGDLGRRMAGGCACGRGLSRMDIVGGRRTDHLIASDGRMMHGLSLIYVLREMEHVERFQIRQNASGGVEVLVVPADTFDRADHRRIADGARALLGDATKLTVQLVDRLEASPSGKFRCVTSQALGQEAAV